MPKGSLPAGVASGVGSLPGTDIVEAVREVFGELADFPYLPELPERGAGADMLGRTAGLLTELPVELYAGTWQLTAREGRDLRRARDFLERDLDALTTVVSEHDGPVKIAATGPWTLSAGLSRGQSAVMLADTGARREVAESLADGLVRHVSEVAARMPGAQMVVQLDEPSLPAILAGAVPTASGLTNLAAVPRFEAVENLSRVVDAVGVPVVVHCCASDVPLGLIRACGAAGVSLDTTLLSAAPAESLDAFGEAVEAGLGVLAGAVLAIEVDEEPSAKAAAEVIDTLWQRLGLERSRLREQVCVTPTCGLAARSRSRAREIVTVCTEAARWLWD